MPVDVASLIVAVIAGVGVALITFMTMRHFSREHQQATVDTLQPFKENIETFRSRLELLHDHSVRDNTALRSEISHLKQLNTRLAEQAQQLTNALTTQSKTQGIWGEVTLLTILEQSGLRDGEEYVSQTSFTTDDGKRRQPDVIVKLPENRAVVIDAKVSLTAYLDYVNADNDSERQMALTALKQSVQRHIKDLGSKQYQLLDGMHQLDFVILFVPMESMLALAIGNDSSLLTLAEKHNICLASPLTLLTILRTIDNLWRLDRQSKNAADIAAKAGAIYDDIVLLMEKHRKLGDHLKRAQDMHAEIGLKYDGGRHSVRTKIDTLKQLGATTSRQPE